MQLCRTQSQAEDEEKAAAVEKKKNELLETTRLHAKYVQENQESYEEDSEHSYESYTAKEHEQAQWSRYEREKVDERGCWAASPTPVKKNH